MLSVLLSLCYCYPVTSSRHCYSQYICPTAVASAQQSFSTAVSNYLLQHCRCVTAMLSLCYCCAVTLSLLCCLGAHCAHGVTERSRCHRSEGLLEIADIVRAARPEAALMSLVKDAPHVLGDLNRSSFDVVALGQMSDPCTAKEAVPDKALMGNLDPGALFAEPEGPIRHTLSAHWASAIQPLTHNHTLTHTPYHFYLLL